MIMFTPSPALTLLKTPCHHLFNVRVGSNEYHFTTQFTQQGQLSASVFKYLVFIFYLNLIYINIKLILFLLLLLGLSLNRNLFYPTANHWHFQFRATMSKFFFVECIVFPPTIFYNLQNEMKIQLSSLFILSFYWFF